ncbi:receptor activity-modifying protein 1 isoform X1 [Panthera pardus]|uniref:Receptor activity-modifying protein 1 isoform X1 n=1 Tax=Panthera pardus TaxID=9691 RepID=A0A9W2VKB0_PANPR|nr:receptor activity-modifying protein 1 isoform X1 [Panthera pardus]
MQRPESWNFPEALMAEVWREEGFEQGGCSRRTRACGPGASPPHGHSLPGRQLWRSPPGALPHPVPGGHGGHREDAVVRLGRDRQATAGTTLGTAHNLPRKLFPEPSQSGERTGPAVPGAPENTRCSQSQGAGRCSHRGAPPPPPPPPQPCPAAPTHPGPPRPGSQPVLSHIRAVNAPPRVTDEAVDI